MKKRIVCFIFAVALLIVFVIPSFADTSKKYVVDNANLLSESEESALENKLKEISERQKCDVVVLTVNSLGSKDATQYADDYYDYNGYGYGTNHDGILLLISMKDRDWAVSTCGFGIKAFTDDGIEYLSDQFMSDLSDGNYANAFNIYAEKCDDFIQQAKNGRPYNSYNLPRKPLSLVWIPVCIILGFVIATLIVSYMKRKLKSVRMQAGAGAYVRDGSMRITDSRDIFLYSSVTRTAIPKSNGSSTHSSSSGRTHGGSRGKF